MFKVFVMTALLGALSVATTLVEASPNNFGPVGHVGRNIGVGGGGSLSLTQPQDVVSGSTLQVSSGSAPVASIPTLSNVGLGLGKS